MPGRRPAREGASVALSLGAALALAAVWLWPDPRPVAAPTPPPPADQPAAEAPKSSLPQALRLPPPPAPPAPAVTVAAPVAEPVAAPPPPKPRVVTALKPTPAPKPVPQATPQPEPKRVTALKPRPRPAPQPVAQAPKPEPAPQKAPEAPPEVVPDTTTVAEGRARLRLLEHGLGPAIEIAWPEAAADRARLHDRLTACFGMRLAAMDGAGRLYLAEDPPGMAWEPNMDRFSGFIRYPAGAPVAAERRELDRILARHGLADARPVRLFPRALDARLLGGLGRIANGDPTAGKTIHARYRLSGGRLLVEDVTVDGQARPGRVVLGPTAGPCAGERRA